jgi:nucleotide-binding universal stress UspA family protein
MRNNKILIPVDGSDFSLQVIPYAKRFLRPEESEIVLLYVTEQPGLVELGPPGNPELTIYADQEAASIEAGFVSAMQPQIRYLTQAGFAVTTAVRFGEPTFEIERFINEEQIDLVVMATHGRTGLARMLLGSVAQHVVNHAAVPVLLYRTFGQTATTQAQEPQAAWKVLA